MVGKLCAGPKGGGSAGGLAAYLVGYAVAGKGASTAEIAAAIDAVDLEAEARGDRGVGEVWAPAAGHGTRPSSVLVRNCDSYATAAMEMDADAATNAGVRHSAMHFVWSFSTGESARLSDDQVHAYVGDVLSKLGLAEHRSIAVVHRDTLVRDASGAVIDGNLHVHVAVGAVHPRTGLAYDRTGLYKRMARAERDVELEHGLEHDRGLYVVRDPGTGEARVEEATREELAAWRRERREERLVAMERRSAEGYRTRDVTFSRYADATVAPRLRMAMEASRQAGPEPDWATLHAVAARYGCELQADAEGRVVLRDVGVGELRLAHERERRDLRREMEATGAERDAIDDALAERKAAHERDETAERDRKRKEGDTVALDATLGDDRADMPAFEDEEAAERAYIAAVEAEPEIVLRELTSSSSTFARDDVDAALGRRIADPLELERLGDLVVRHESVRALSADARYPLLTTTEILAAEERLHTDARELAGRSSGITAADVAAAIARFEAKQSTAAAPFRLSTEQRDGLGLLERGACVVLEGLPGTGKTTVMSAVRELAEAQGRRIVGLTLSQAAAERLESEAGFGCVNTARARIMEQGGEEVIPRRGIVVVDEAAMVDSRAMARIVELAKERESVVFAIGDTRQLQPIDAGASFRILRDVAHEAGAYAELRDVQRQKRDWHREAVVLLADAIAERDEGQRLDLVRRAVATLEEHGAITWAADRDSAIDHAVTSARTYRAAGFTDTLLLAGDKDTVRHLSEQERREQGREGLGNRYATSGGCRELVEGDRFIFLENSLTGKRALGVRNGDTGTVLHADAGRVEVRLDRDDGRVVAFSPRSYRAWDHANALTVHKSQGASVGAGVAVFDRSASAELAFVAASRSKHALDFVVPLTAFRDVDDLARHIADRIAIKTTTRNFEEVVERTGGRATDRVRNIAAQRDAESSTLRRLWHEQVVEPLRAVRVERLRIARTAYAKEREAAAGGSLTARLERQRDVLRDFRRRAAEIIAETTPQRYNDWLREREHAQERAHETRRTREAERRLLRSAERTRSGPHDTMQRGETHDRERQDHGFER